MISFLTICAVIGPEGSNKTHPMTGVKSIGHTGRHMAAQNIDLLEQVNLVFFDKSAHWNFLNITVVLNHWDYLYI